MYNAPPSGYYGNTDNNYNPPPPNVSNPYQPPNPQNPPPAEAIYYNQMGSNNPVNYGGAANVAPAQNVYPPQQGGAPNYAPPSPSYPAQGSRGIEVVRAQLTKFSDRSKYLDHPSIPRLMPSDIAENLARFPAAPAHIRTTSLLSVRPTFAIPPQSTTASKFLQSIGLPVGVVVRPFAEQDVPVADFSSFGDKMIRCRKCTAYINPFCTFSEGGRKWMCSLCRYSNETPKSYYCPTDESGLRQDINDRPELLNCSIDLLATPEFLKSPPMRPVIVFLLDFSYAAVSSGLLGVMCDAALAALENLKDNDALHVAVVGFDNNVYLTNFGENAAGTPRIVVVPDVVNELCNINDSFRLEPIELPCAVRECVVPLKFCFDQLCTLLQELPNMFASTKEVGCAFGGALSASVTLLSRTGGKIISSICSIPSNGEGKLKQRFDMGSLSGKPNEYTVCSVGNDWYKQRALVCSSCNISFDLVAGGTDDLDLATISPLCRYTSGNIVRASPANMSGMTEQVQLMIERAVAFDSVFRVRSSNGVVIQNFYGHCHVKEPDLLSLPIATTDSTYGIELKIPHDYLLKFVYLQFASVYTTPSQERRIRVHTVQLRVSQNPTDVINSIDSFGMASFLCRSCVDLAGSSPFEQAQAKTNERLATALRFCQTHLTAVGQTPGAGQLLIPVSMQFIPQILNGFYRLPAVCLGSKTPIRPDERIASMSTVMTCSPEALAAISAMWCYTVYSPGHRVEELPMQMHSSISCFRNDGMYFVNLGVSLVLWYGTMVHPEILKLFGLPPNEENNAAGSQEYLSPDELDALRERTENLLWEHKTYCSPAFNPGIEFVKAKSNPQTEALLSKAMVEDDYSERISSYGGYLLRLWQQVNAKK